MTRVVLFEKDKNFPQYWKHNGSGITSTTNSYKCMWCYEFTGNHIPVIKKGDYMNMSKYGVCTQCAIHLESFWIDI